MRGKPLLAWLIAAFAVSLLGAASAVASPQPSEIREYEHDFDVSHDTAERNLEVQERGAGIVGELKAGLGKRYAGVWFDNDTGEFVVPLLPGADRIAVASQLADDGLSDQYRVMPAASSWEELEASQARLDNYLQDHIKAQLVQTSLDPRTNAVVIHEAKAVGGEVEAGLRLAAAKEGVRVEVKPGSVERFNFEPLACKTSAPRACGRPLRGGVSLTRNTSSFHQIGECSTGFKALANGNRYILTAGHCAALFSSWGSEDASETFHPIGGVAEYKFPGGDWARITANGSSYWDWSPWPSQVAHYWEDQERPINYEAWSYLGQYVCHSGTQSGTSCGGVSALDVTAPYGVNHLTEVTGVCAMAGDSGGPVFAGSTALGLLSGGDLEFPECQRPILYVEITEATSAMGVSVGTRLGGAPTVTTNAASNISAGKATLNGGVIPNGVETQYYFQYGTTTGYGSVIPIPSGNVGHGTGAVGVNVSLGNLQPSQTYNYRVVASSSAGTSFGSNVQFKTLAPTIPGEDDNFGGGHPVVKSNGTIDVFYRTASGGLGHTVYVNGSWSLAPLPGSLASLSVPHPIVQSNGTIDVFYRTPSGGLGHNAYVNGVWGQDVLPGSLASDPHPVVKSNGTIDVFYRTASGGLGHTVYVNGSWSLAPLPGSVSGDPYPVVQSNGTIDVFYRTPSGGLGHNAYAGGFWGQDVLPGEL